MSADVLRKLESCLCRVVLRIVVSALIREIVVEVGG